MQRSVFTLAAILALAPAAARAQGGPFLAAEGPDLWRASKLVGIDVLGPDGRKVGETSAQAEDPVKSMFARAQRLMNGMYVGQNAREFIQNS